MEKQVINLGELPDADLWRLRCEQQEVITNCVVQIQQANDNINAVKAEQERRENAEKPKADKNAKDS